MIQRNVRNHRQQRANDVRTVQAPTQPHFYHGNVYLLFGKILKSQGCGQFEKGGVQRFEEIALFGHKIDHTLLRDGRTVHPNALTKIDQMGRGVQPYSIAGTLQNGGQRVGSRPFAVRTAHMDGGIAPMRVAEMSIKHLCGGKSLFIRPCPDVLKQRGRVVEIVKCLLITHCQLK